MASRRKAACRALTKKCSAYKTEELETRFDDCLSPTEAKRVRSYHTSRGRKKFSKADYCRHIKLSTAYDKVDPDRVSVSSFKRIAKANSRKKYDPKMGILSPLVYPTKRLVPAPLRDSNHYYSIMSEMILASTFKDDAVVYLPKTESNWRDLKGVRYRVKNTFDLEEIKAAKGDKDKEAMIVAVKSKIKIDYPTGMWEALAECSKRFFVVFVSIDANRFRKGYEYSSRHSNVLIVDLKIKEVERFEPLGYITYPKYEYEVFDADLTKKFGEHGIRYIPTIDWEPRLGLQKHELYQSEALDIPDNVPWSGGFCSFWTYLWTYMRLNNPKLSREQLFAELVQAFHRIRILTFMGSLLGALVKQNERRALKLGWDPKKMSYFKWQSKDANYQKLLKSFGLKP